jgi:hypothetical protein
VNHKRKVRSKWDRFWDNIEVFVWNTRWHVKSFFVSLHNFWKWKGIVWNDRDCEVESFLKLLEFKLYNMGHRLTEARDSETTREGEKILELARSVQYLIEPDNIKRLFRESRKIPDDFGDIELITDKDGFPQIVGKYDNNEELQKLHKKLTNKQIKKHEQIKKELFDGMRDGYESWWDVF